MTIRRMRVAICIIKDTRVQAHAHGLAQHPAASHTHTHTHTRARTHLCRQAEARKQYVLFIAFPQQQWSCKRASSL